MSRTRYDSYHMSHRQLLIVYDIIKNNENQPKQFDTMCSESGFSKNVHSSQGKCHAGNELILKTKQFQVMVCW